MPRDEFSNILPDLEAETMGEDIFPSIEAWCANRVTPLQPSRVRAQIIVRADVMAQVMEIAELHSFHPTQVLAGLVEQFAPGVHARLMRDMD